jgi:hypothetical protein
MASTKTIRKMTTKNIKQLCISASQNAHDLCLRKPIAMINDGNPNKINNKKLAKIYAGPMQEIKLTLLTNKYIASNCDNIKPLAMKRNHITPISKGICFC